MYLQLTLLTPWLFRLIDRPTVRAALYAVTPLTLCTRYALSATGSSLPIQAFCGSWLLFYLLGLEWRGRVAPWLGRRGVGARQAPQRCSPASRCRSWGGFAWLALGSYDLATTQLKVTSMLSSACACALVVLAADPARRRLAGCAPLVRLGDLSFGIYLCHMAVLAVFQKAFVLVGLVGFTASLLLWLAVLAASAGFVAVCRRMLPRGVLAAIGFA